MTTGGLIPDQYRLGAYKWAIHKLPDFYAVSDSQTVIMDEPFHLLAFRQMWDESAKQLGLRLHWVEAVCDREIAKARIEIRNLQENGSTSPDSFVNFLLFEETFEPFTGHHEIVDTSIDIRLQVERILKERSIKRA